MKTTRIILATSAVTSSAFAFHVAPRQVRARTSLFDMTVGGMEGGPFSTEELDLKRAKECAENFGKCSVKEVEKLRDGKAIIGEP